MAWNSGNYCSWVADWLHADPTILGPSLTRYIGSTGYDLHQLHDDIAQFAFLLGGNDGEHLLEPADPGATGGET